MWNMWKNTAGFLAGLIIGVGVGLGVGIFLTFATLAAIGSIV